MDKCGCGKDIKYLFKNEDIEIGSCNKYFVCPTYDYYCTNGSILSHKLSIVRCQLQRINECNLSIEEYKERSKVALDVIDKSNGDYLCTQEDRDRHNAPLIVAGSNYEVIEIRE